MLSPLQPVLLPVLGASTAHALFAGSSAIDRILGAGGLDYALWKRGPLDRLSQGFAGANLVDLTSIGQSVGYWIDQSKQDGLALDAYVQRQPELIANQSLAGAVVGTIGAGGALPTGWAIASFSTVQVLAIGEEDGAHYLDLRLAHANAGGSTIFPYIEAGGSVPGTANDRFTVRTWYKKLAGAWHPDPSAFLNARLSDGTNNSYPTKARPGEMLEKTEITWGFSPGLASMTSATLRYLMFNLGAGQSVDVTVRLYAPSVKKAAVKYARQDNTGPKPKLLTGGVTGDALDDGMITSWHLQAGANCAVVRFKAPATISSTQSVLGAFFDNKRFRMDLNTAGGVFFALGDVAGQGSPAFDVRDKVVTAAITCDGSFGQVFVEGLAGAPFAQTGGLDTTVPMALLASNSGSSLSLSSAAEIEAIAFGRVHLSPSDFNAIAAELAA